MSLFTIVFDFVSHAGNMGRPTDMKETIDNERSRKHGNPDKESSYFNV